MYDKHYRHGVQNSTFPRFKDPWNLPGISSRCPAIYSCDFFEDSNEFYKTGFPPDVEL